MEYELKGNRTGRETPQSEALLLIKELEARLRVQSNRLDLSPKSLRSLDQLLLEYVQLQSDILMPVPSWTQQEILTLVRQIAAYIGLTLLRNLSGRWESNDRLMGPLFIIDGPIKIVDGSCSYTSQGGMSFPLGNVAANGLDLAIAGKKPNFYSVYQRAKNRVAKQRL